MSDQFAPRSDPQGEYTRTCPACGQEFRTDNPRAKYCTYECRRQAQNRRHYEAHRKDIITAVIERRKQKQQQHIDPTPKRKNRPVMGRSAWGIGACAHTA